MPRTVPVTQKVLNKYLYYMNYMNFYSFRKQRNGKVKIKITVNHLSVIVINLL